MKRFYAFLIGSLLTVSVLAQTVVLVTAVPTPSGTVSSKFRDGNDGTSGLAWATIGPFVNIIEGATPCFDLRTYLTEPGSPDATLSLVGSVTNWSLSTDDLCYDGAGISSGTLIASASRSGVTSDSASFAVSSVASSGTDTTQPTIATGLTCTLNGSDDPVCTFDAAADVRVSGENTSGLNTFTPQRNGTPLTPITYTGSGLSPTYTGADVGVLSPVGTSVQSVADWTLTAEGVTDDTHDEFRFVSTPITGDFTCSVRITSISSSVTDTRISLIAREQTGTLRRYVSVRVLPTFSVRGHYRTVAEGSATSSGLVSYSALPLDIQLQRAGNAWTGRSSDDRNIWDGVVTTTLGLNQTLDVGIAAYSASNGNPVTVGFENLTCTSRPQQTFTDSAATPGTTPLYTVVSTDVATNVSEPSTGFSISVPTGPPPGNFLFEETFDSTAWFNRQGWGTNQSATGNPNAAGTMTRRTSATRGVSPFSGPFLEVKINANQHLGTEAGIFMSELGDDADPGEWRYLRFYMALGTGSDWSPKIGYNGKFPGLASLGGQCGTGGNLCDGTDGWTARGILTNYETACANNGRQGVSAYLYYGNDPTPTGHQNLWSNYGTCSNGFIKGQWYCVERAVQLNTIGQNNGRFLDKVNGQTVLDQTGVLLDSTSNFGVERAFMNVYRGGATPSLNGNDLYFFMDEIVYDDQPIGCGA